MFFICPVCKGLTRLCGSRAIIGMNIYLLSDDAIKFLNKLLSSLHNEWLGHVFFLFVSLPVLWGILLLARKHSRTQIVGKSLRWCILDFVLIETSRFRQDSFVSPTIIQPTCGIFSPSIWSGGHPVIHESHQLVTWFTLRTQETFLFCAEYHMN